MRLSHGKILCLVWINFLYWVLYSINIKKCNKNFNSNHDVSHRFHIHKTNFCGYLIAFKVACVTEKYDMHIS